MFTSKPYLPDFLDPPKPDFPLLVELVNGSSPAAEVAAECRGMLDDRLPEVGAVLLRDLPIANPEDFQKFVVAMGFELMPTYVGTAPRAKDSKADFVFQSSDDPPAFTVEPHQELTYVERVPSKLFFFCEAEARPGDGGELGVTNIAKMSHDPYIQEFLQQCQAHGGLTHGLTLAPNVNADRMPTWKQFGESKEEAVEAARALGWSQISWDGDMMTARSFVPGFVTHPVTNETVLFSQIGSVHSTYYEGHPFLSARSSFISVAFADGVPIDDDTVARLRAKWWEYTHAVPMKTGDVMCLDNILAGHARMGFKEGSPRKMKVMLAKPPIDNSRY